MKYASTRTTTQTATLSEAILRGIAPDGGLYVPERFPDLYLSDFGTADSLVDIAQILLAPFCEEEQIAESLDQICRDAFDLPAPLVQLDDSNSVLELFHGPTAAFKDFGARFLGGVLSALQAPSGRTLTVLAATSGDTGGAVAAALHDRPGLQVVVLYPEGRISPRQEKQITCWGGNVRALRVRGDFDDCQRLAKQAFADSTLRDRLRLTSANSINIGRLLPQMVAFAHASLAHLRQHGEAPGFVIPTGNLGNAVACLWAQEVGLPIREVVLATNANQVINQYLETGQWEPLPDRPTLATAMDVGNPSNFERLEKLCGSWSLVRRRVRAISVDDDQIREQIRTGPVVWGQLWDPHTACAAAALDQLEPRDWIMVATAHPAKFETTVEPLIGHPVEVPPTLAALLDQEGHFEEIDATLEALRKKLLEQNPTHPTTNPTP
ncbi:threonine synthase [soil metagenome]